MLVDCLVHQATIHSGDLSGVRPDAERDWWVFILVLFRHAGCPPTLPKPFSRYADDRQGEHDTGRNPEVVGSLRVLDFGRYLHGSAHQEQDQPKQKTGDSHSPILKIPHGFVK